MKSQFGMFILFLWFTTICCKLKFVFEFYRNGVSAPKVLNKNMDIFGEKWFKTNEITGFGMKQQYLIGAKLRRHYISGYGFLDKTFNSNQIKLLSLDTNHNILTMYSQLLGLYPSPSGPELNQQSIRASLPSYDLYNAEDVYKKMEFQALPNQAEVFPIKTFPPDNHFFGLTNQHICKGVGPHIEKNKEKVKVKNFISKFAKNYFNNFQKTLNLTDGYFNYYTNVSSFCDQFICGVKDKRELKKVQELNDTGKIDIKTLYDDCMEFKALDLFDVKLGDTKNEVVTVANTNMILKIISYLDEVVQNDNKTDTSKTTKFVMYSGHERDVGAIIAYFSLALQTQNYYPKFSSSLLLEFIKNSKAPKLGAKDSDFTIHIYFNEKTLKTISYSDFKKKVLALTVSSSVVDDFCGFTDLTSLYYKIAAIFLSMAFVGFGAWILYLFKKPKHVEDHGDDELNEKDMRKKLAENEELNQ